MRDITLNAVKHFNLGDDGIVAFEVPRVAAIRDRLWASIRGNNSNGYFKLRIGHPKRARSTGKKSQCNRVNGYVQWICMQTGDDFNDMKTYLKRQAFRRGFPMLRDDDGNIVYSRNDGLPLPISEADASVEEDRALIEEIQQFAAEESIPLPERLEDGSLIYI